MRLRLAVALALIGAATSIMSPAQDSVSAEASARPKPKAPIGIVTGTVYCADTNAPARLARVLLIGESDRMVRPSEGTVDLDGHFSIGNVPEAKYYVSVKQPGYLDPEAFREKTLTPEARKEVEKHLVAVIVSAKQPAEVSIRLERAAEIDGSVLYDDGSPGVGLHIELKASSDLSESPQMTDGVTSLEDYAEEYSRTTDDRGRYRLLNVRPGEYLVSVTVPAGSGEEVAKHPLQNMLQTTSFGGLKVFYGDVFRSSKAKRVKIETAGSTFTADITIPLSKLHTIRGRVILKSTGDPPAAGGVILQYADTHEYARVGIFDGTGEFAIFYVPEDSYVLGTAASLEPLPDLSDEDVGETVGFSSMGFRVDADPKLPNGMVSVPLLVTGDVTGITVSVPDPPPSAKNSSEDPESDAAPQPPAQPEKPQPRE